jgi:hypothetical protein
MPEDATSLPLTITQRKPRRDWLRADAPQKSAPVTSACLALRNPTDELWRRNRQATGFCPCVGLAASDRRRLAAKSATLAADEWGNSAFRVHT